MDRIPLLIVGHEPEWISRQVAGAFRSLPANVQYTFVVDVPPPRSVCFLATDDLLWPGLARTASRLATKGRRVILLSWADPLNLWVTRDWPLHGLFTLPAERDRLRSFLSTMSTVPRLQDVDFRNDVPASVVTALRVLLRQGRSPLSQPPPRSITALAERLGMDASYLGRQSRTVGLDLVRLCGIVAVRWVRLYIEAFGYDDPDLPARLGYSSVRSVRRWVRTTTGQTLKGLRATEVRHIDDLIRVLLSPVGTWAVATSDDDEGSDGPRDSRQDDTAA